MDHSEPSTIESPYFAWLVKVGISQSIIKITSVNDYLVFTLKLVVDSSIIPLIIGFRR